MIRSKRSRTAWAAVACLAVTPLALSVASLRAESAPASLAALVQQAAGVQEVLREIRVHGNYSTPDAEVVRLAGLELGQALGTASLADARIRLQRSGRFVAVEMRKRYRSLDDPTDVALVIVVQEHPVSDVAAPAVGAVGRVGRTLDRALGGAMFMPILNFTDGYGLTYGARVSFVDALGSRGRLSLPVTWGGTKRVAAEIEKSVASGPIDTVTASASVARRTNPHYEIDDDRAGATLAVSRKINPALRVGAHVGFESVTFGGIGDRFPRYGVDATLDTRADPAFPRNAVLATIGWERLGFRAVETANVVRVDARGFVGLFGQTVLCLRGQLARADRPLPPYERLLLGGADSLRGYRAGTYAGDSLAAGSIELRVPTSSPLSFARMGVDVFADVGAVTDHGTPIRAASFHPGFGGGVFMVASVFRLTADVGVRRGGGVRLHVMSGVHF